MQMRPVLELSDVEAIAAAARAEAEANGWKVTIAIVDEGGHPLALQRLEGAAPMSAYVSVEKARTAALGRRDSAAFEQMINGGRTAFVTTTAITGLLEGGVPVMVGGQCIGAVGVSGVKSDQDAQIARAGVAAVSA